MNEPSMNLRQMYERNMTPERRVEAFRRFVIRLKQQKSFGRELSSRDYFQVDTALFREEALYMKGLDAECDTGVRLTKEIRCLEEMTDEQILCYYTLVKRFRNNVMERVSMAYARYYMLEVVNLIYQDTPGEACRTLFAFWDALNAGKKVSPECTEYFYQLCQLFMLAYEELMPGIVAELELRSGRDWSGKTLEQIARGDYRCAAQFVLQYGRLLKKEDICSEAADIRHTREALPFVFARLEERFPDSDFRNAVLNGFYAAMYIGDYPVLGGIRRGRQTVSLSEYRYYEYQEYSDYWRYQYFVLRESVQDFLNVVRQYTHSCVRSVLKLGAGKCSAVRFLKKSYEHGADRPADVAHLKKMVEDERFEAAVKEGVLLCLEELGVPIPERKRRERRKKVSEEIDYGCPVRQAPVDPERLRQARADADSVLDMLSEGEIDYAGGTEPAPEVPAPLAAPDPGEEPDGEWTPDERHYFGLVREGKAEEASQYLLALQMPEQVMMKRINEKALEMLGDILLERRGRAVCILEDYEAEADRIWKEHM